MIETRTQTKLEKLLQDKNVTQGELIRLIKEKSGFKCDRAYISRICTGIQRNYTVETAVMIAEALSTPEHTVTINDIVDIKDVKRQNIV